MHAQCGRVGTGVASLHVRVVSPARLTKSLTDWLAADAGVVNLVVLPGSAERPHGDAV